VGLSTHARPQSISLKLPTLRFRAKIMLGFAVVLAISAVSMGIAYLGFERVSAGVASYRNSVLEADLARNIDRELISYQALARYYVVTGVQSVAQGTHEAAATIVQVNRGATETGSTSADVLNSARTLSTESTRLREEFDRFMSNIRAA
jgi:CHASE3 domain sensor protein